MEVPTEYQDFIVISSTPSFDPNVGTGSPGDPKTIRLFLIHRKVRQAVLYKEEDVFTSG